MISIRGPKLKILAGILAVIALVAGIYITFFQSRGFVKTTGTILSLREEADSDDSSIFYPTVEYNVDEKTYTTELNTGSGSYKVGKSITVLYDPDEPAVAHSGTGLGIYSIVVGIVILVILIYSTVRKNQDLRQVREQQKHGRVRGYAPSTKGEERELYFLTDLGTAKYGHHIEDGERRVLYEAKMTRFALTSPFGFDFIDYEHGTTTHHLVGHSEESDWGNSILLDNHYTFELDGVDIFRHLKQNGITVDTSFGGGSGKLLGLNVRILRDGVEIARAESTSQYPHEEDAKRHKAASAIPVQGFYRIWTGEQNLDLLFVTLLAFARSGASDDRGGTFGAVVGTVKNWR